ncbi:MAG: Hpt domain-containing protein [Spirochaetaceae bacterium]|jgi:HPt (histidine-containing phosphotransfer) domain-containing protein|nr:Hpt domain-containing protein [Spirochaetaceae bacterium]
MSSEYVDVESALARVRGKTALYRRMLDMLLQSEEFTNLDTYLNEKEYSKAAETAHAIKGMTGNLSLTRLYEDSTTLLQELRQGEPSAETLEKYRSSLEKTFLSIKEVIARLDQNP